MSESEVTDLAELIEDTIGGDIRDEVAALIEENPELYDFYEETYNILFDNFQTINHAVTSRSSWEGFEKRLTSERPKSSNS